MDISIEELAISKIEPLSSENPLAEDKLILLLLNLSAFSFFITPWLGIAIPLAIWAFFKEKIHGVNEMGKAIIKSQIVWCLVLLFTFLYSMFLSPQSPIQAVIFQGGLYVFNTVVCLFLLIKSAYIKKMDDQFA